MRHTEGNPIICVEYCLLATDARESSVCVIFSQLKVRKAGAPMPRKFMGHGICDNLARSCVLPMATDESHVIARECVTLLRDVKVHAEDMRGMGIQVSKLSPSSGSRGARTLLDFVNLQAGTSHGSGASGAENDEGRRASASLSTDGGAGGRVIFLLLIFCQWLWIRQSMKWPTYFKWWTHCQIRQRVTCKSINSIDQSVSQSVSQSGSQSGSQSVSQSVSQ